MAETPAQRWARDTQSRGGDYQLVANSLVLDADGRQQREYLQRRGDWYVDANGALAYDADGRNAREYADKDTLVSAVTNTIFEPYDLDQDNVRNIDDAEPTNPAVQ